NLGLVLVATLVLSLIARNFIGINQQIEANANHRYESELKYQRLFLAIAKFDARVSKALMNQDALKDDSEALDIFYVTAEMRSQSDSETT
ncbi:hypothetical protein ABTM46_19075, partial [Acinetobacter baumannii]